MSSNDHVRSWQNKKMKGDGAVEDVGRRERGRERNSRNKLYGFLESLGMATN